MIQTEDTKYRVLEKKGKSLFRLAYSYALGKNGIK